MNIKPGAENLLAPHSRKDYSKGGLNSAIASDPIISGGELMDQMIHLYAWHHRGGLTVEEWVTEQRAAVAKTVPGRMRDLFERALAEEDEANPLPVTHLNVLDVVGALAVV